MGTPRFIALCRYCGFHTLTFCGNPELSKSIGIFPAVFAHFMFVSHFGNSHGISLLNYYCICYGDLGSQVTESSDDG